MNLFEYRVELYDSVLAVMNVGVATVKTWKSRIRQFHVKHLIKYQIDLYETLKNIWSYYMSGKTQVGSRHVESSWNVMAHGDARDGKWRGKLANGVGSQYPSHYLGTWYMQHYYRWCAHLGCQYSTELTPLPI